MEKDLENLTHCILDILKGYGIGKYGIRNYYYEGFKPIIEVCSKNGVTNYVEADILSALKTIAADAKSGKIAKVKAPKSRKAAFLLKEYVSTGSVTLHRLRPEPKIRLSDYYEAISHGFDEYLQAIKNLVPESRQTLVSISRSFLKYLDDNGRPSIQLLDLKIVKDFLIFSTQNHACSMDYVQRSLKYLAEYLLQNNKCLDFRDALLSRPAPRRKLRPVFTDAEVDALLEEAKKSATNPLRDTAIIMIASNLGLRAIDIVNLKLQDIDWYQSTLKFVQHKTKVECELPFEAEVGNAIAAYILKERPSTKEPFVFIRSRAPFVGLGSPALGDMVRSYMRASDRITYESGDLKGFHSFRRYVATKMIDADVPKDTVKDVLGHLSIDSMKPYIRISRNKLALCALDISRIPVSQEEYL